MNRAFKYLTIQAGGVPQPLVGTYLTAPVLATSLQPSSDTPLPIQVADTTVFLKGDWITLVDPTTFAGERVRVFAVVDATHLSVQLMAKPHPGGAYGTGAWVALGAMAQSAYVQCLDGNAGALYIGDGPQMVKATGLRVIAKLATVAANAQAVDFSTSRQGLANAETLSQYWIDGTTGDSYLPSIGVV